MVSTLTLQATKQYLFPRTRIRCIAFNVLLCFILYACAVLIAVYAFITNIGFYLVHCNSIIVIFMNRERSPFVRGIYPIVGFAAYVLARFHNQNWVHISIAGLLNILEQVACHFIMIKTLQVHDCDVYKSIWFLQVLGIVSFINPIVFAAVGTELFHVYTHAPFKITLITYYFSHITGTYIGLYAYYVLRCTWRRKPSRSYLIDITVVITIAILLNAFVNYGFFEFAAVILAFPLLAYISVRHDQGWSIIADLSLILITCVSLLFGRGPYITKNTSTLNNVVSLYVMLMCSTVMTAVLCLYMQQRRDALKHIVELKDDVFLISGQISHDIRAPIAHIMAVCDSMIAGTHADDDLMEVALSCQTVNEIMDSWLMMLSVLECTDKKDEVGNTNLLDDTIKEEKLETLMKRLEVYGRRMIVDVQKPLTFTLQQPLRASYGAIQYNGKLLHHVLVNLISNAVKYSARGEIRLEACILADQSMLKFVVSDQGKGISAEHLEHLFERFYRVESDADEHHTANTTSISLANYGVGLNIVRSLITRMRGGVNVSSIVGVGTSFTITVPCVLMDKSDEDDLGGDEEDDSGNSLLAGLHALIAEDNVICARLYRRHLAACASTQVVVDGALVMPAIREGKYDIVLLDGKLPNRSGKQVLMQTLHETSTLALVPVFVTISGANEMGSGDEWKPLCVEKCTKPFSKEQLLVAIHKALRRRQRANQMTLSPLPKSPHRFSRER